MATEPGPNFGEHPIAWDNEKVSRLWNYYSRTPPYSEVYFSRTFGRQILERSGLALDEPIDVLDFGCGPGFIWEHLRQLEARWQYTALDFSPDSVAKVREKANGHPCFKGAHHLGSLPSSLPDAYFDAVLLVEVVEHLDDEHLNGTIWEASRLLKPGGVVVITTPNEEDLSQSRRFCPECGAVFHEWQHVRSWSVDSLTAYLKQHGFALHMAKTLDFNTQGFTVIAVLRKLERLARRILKGRLKDPHMIAVFRKD